MCSGMSIRTSTRMSIHMFVRSSRHAWTLMNVRSHRQHNSIFRTASVDNRRTSAAHMSAAHMSAAHMSAAHIPAAHMSAAHMSAAHIFEMDVDAQDGTPLLQVVVAVVMVLYSYGPK